MNQKFYQIEVISSQVKFFCHIKMLFPFSNVTLTNEGDIVRERSYCRLPNYAHKQLKARATHIITP